MPEDDVDYISPQQFADRMKWLSDEGGGEMGHVEADELMGKVLRQLGYGEGVDIFEHMPNVWYS